jgi:(E)-4-hydroxy-3-methylbut-2-enyl-diphosphate synthase
MKIYSPFIDYYDFLQGLGSDEKVKEVIKAAKDYGCAIRIGVNAGSLEQDLLNKYKTPTPEALVESAQRHIKILEDNDFFETKIASQIKSHISAFIAHTSGVI